MPTSRISKSARERFGLFAIVESRRTLLPLKGVECDFAVTSGVVEVSMTQIYRQENPNPMDCEYLFPLPADAAVYRCEADINGRVIRAQVREREEAQQLAAEKKAEGFRTILVESERDNLFTLSLGNIQSDDVVIIELKYFQTLRSLAGMPSVEIPFCPGQRYIPGGSLLRSNRGKGTVDDTDQVPDASRISPVRIDAAHPDAAYVEVRGTFDARFVQELSSPSHSLATQRVGDELLVSLSNKGDVPDRDFVVRWKETSENTVASRTWLRKKGKDTFALLEIRAPQNAAAERAPVDFYFLVDRSGSMADEKWHKAVEALQSCVKVLSPSDRAMVTFFESSYRDFAEGPLSPGQLLADPEFQAIKKLGARGGTELASALQHVLEITAEHSVDRRKNLILITDAQVGNESPILALMRKASDLPVHCFGIDVALNDALLLALCRQQGGTFHSMNPNDDIQQAVAGLGRTLGQPVLLDLQISQGWELADASIPNLYAGQIHYLSARSSSGRPPELQGLGASGQPVKVELNSGSARLDAPYLHWCRSRIHRLLAEKNDSSAIALSVESNLICRLTAFIAWDDSEKVAISNQELVQPNLGSALQMRFASVQSNGFCGLPSRHASGADAGGVFEKTFGDAEVRNKQDLFEMEQGYRRELTDICHRVGVVGWKALLKAIFGWIAKAKGDERMVFHFQLMGLVRKVKVCATPFFSSTTPLEEAQLAPIRQEIQELLTSFVERLPADKKVTLLQKLKGIVGKQPGS